MNWIEPPSIEFTPILPDLDPLVARTLYRRGINTPEAAQAFLDPQSYKPASPEELPGLIAIIDRLAQAIRNHESICIWGDFDADGQTSTTILFQALQELQANITFHIPVRKTESHGVNLPHLQKIIDAGAQVILTCDTGITAHTAVEYANSRGVDMLITDHHDLAETLPNACALTDPKLLPEGHALATLSGSGVAYKLAQALFSHYERPLEQVRQFVDLAAIGLVADLTRLTGEARYLVQLGLTELRHTRRIGLQMMMKMAELDPNHITEEHIGFVLGPRLNALGRLADANPAVELLTTSDPVRAQVLASGLEGLNTQRQLLCNQVTQAAEEQLRTDPSLLTHSALVLGHPAWPGGVVGIVASRLVERYQKPAILFSTPPGEPARGSARSVEGLNITAAISDQKDLLINFGGHPMAAGLSMDGEKIPEFRLRLSKTINKMMGKVEKEKLLEIDGWLGLPEITSEFVNSLEKMAPFGPGNEKLTLASHDLSVQKINPIGRNREHLKLTVADTAGNERTVLWWNGAEAIDEIPKGRIDLAYSLRASDWRGIPQIQMELKDIQKTKTERLDVSGVHLEIVDFRQEQSPLEILSKLPNLHEIQIWAEGEDRKAVKGVDRFSLSPAKTLVIWTSPPSNAELVTAIEKCKPQIIYLFGIDPTDQSPDLFIARLAGLAKYAINHLSGRLTWNGLITSTAQRSITVQTGLKWLEASGQVKIVSQNDDDFVVMSDGSPKDPTLTRHLAVELKTRLAETAAYRHHFNISEKDALIWKPQD